MHARSDCTSTLSCLVDLMTSGSSEECFGIHLGTPFSADLGDGNGWVNQTIELRQDYGSPSIGTCLESLIGGNHFRWVVPVGDDGEG